MFSQAPGSPVSASLAPECPEAPKKQSSANAGAGASVLPCILSYDSDGNKSVGEDGHPTSIGPHHLLSLSMRSEQTPTQDEPGMTFAQALLKLGIPAHI
jgi:hypothetical protein